MEAVIDLIENQAQAKLIFLPPYSPDLKPAEQVFSKVKYIMKENDQIFQVCSTPRVLLVDAFAMVTCSDCS
jgi:transposase